MARRFYWSIPYNCPGFTFSYKKVGEKKFPSNVQIVDRIRLLVFAVNFKFSTIFSYVAITRLYKKGNPGQL
jgi:hypothetical protein